MPGSWYRSLLAALGCAVITAASLSAHAAVLVVANRDAETVSFAIAAEPPTATPPRRFNLAAGDVLPIAVTGPAQLSFQAAGRQASYRVVPNGMYYFGKGSNGGRDLQQIGLGAPGVEAREALRPADDPVAAPANAKPAIVVIPVKILYDEDEIASAPAWERRVRARFEQASQIFEKACFARFQIVAVESWESDDKNADLSELLGEFERLVDPAPARVAIGFTGQNRVMSPHLGGTRGPLHSHLLVRERAAQNTEAERLEVLVHELGHFLGAVHSPESNSVMRPALGDHQAHAAKFRIGFDPLNTLAMCLVVEELECRPDVRFSNLRDATQFTLRQIYSQIAQALPNDPAASRYLLRLMREDAQP